MSNDSRLLGIKITNYSKSEVCKQVLCAISENKKIILAAMDVMSVCRVVNENWLKNYINNCDYVLPDGFYVYAASRFLNENVYEQITAYDIAHFILKFCEKNNKKIYFLGSSKSNNTLVRNNVGKKYGAQIIAGGRDGYFSVNDYDSIVTEINASRSQILFVGISSPKREEFLVSCKDKIDSNVIFPVGGLFDIWSGEVNRAPKLFIFLKLEWLYRFISEPKRMWKRVFYYYPWFIFMILIEKVKRSKNA